MLETFSKMNKSELSYEKIPILYRICINSTIWIVWLLHGTKTDTHHAAIINPQPGRLNHYVFQVYIHSCSKYFNGLQYTDSKWHFNETLSKLQWLNRYYTALILGVQQVTFPLIQCVITNCTGSSHSLPSIYIRNPTESCYPTDCSRFIWGTQWIYMRTHIALISLV